MMSRPTRGGLLVHPNRAWAYLLNPLPLNRGRIDSSLSVLQIFLLDVPGLLVEPCPIQMWRLPLTYALTMLVWTNILSGFEFGRASPTLYWNTVAFMGLLITKQLCVSSYNILLISDISNFFSSPHRTYWCLFVGEEFMRYLLSATLAWGDGSRLGAQVEPHYLCHLRRLSPNLKVRDAS